MPTLHVNRRTWIIIHVYCSRSGQWWWRRGGGRGRGRLPGMRVVWPRTTTWWKQWQWWSVKPPGLLMFELQVLLLSRSVLRSLAVGADEERVAASTAAGKGWSRWKGWSLLLLESRWRRGKRFLQRREREGEVVQPPRKVVGVSGCDEGCGGRDDGKSSGDRMCGWEGESRKRWKQGRKDGFLSTLHLIFLSLRPWNPPLFIGGGKGQSCLHEGKIFSPWFDWKHPNRQFKVCTSNCQIWQSKAARGGHFRPATGALLTFIGLNGPYTVIEGFQVAILVHELSILGDKRGIKCTCKTAILTASRGRWWTVTTRRVA